MNGLMTQTIEIQTGTAGTPDGFNEPVLTWATTETTKGRVCKRSAKERLSTDEMDVMFYKAFLPVGCTVTTKKRILCETFYYDVTGIMEVMGARAIHHIECDLKRVE